MTGFFKKLWRYSLGRKPARVTGVESSPPEPGPATGDTVETPPARSRADQTSSERSAADLARPAVERLLEDERLRGSLTDDGYGPIMTAVSGLIQRAAERSISGAGPADAESLATAARLLTRGLVRAAETGSAEPLANVTGPPLIGEATAARIAARLPGALRSDLGADERARALAALLHPGEQEDTGGL